uniref:Uncharacterized protein n=1 Tax=Utricularia reniformis TaxID=192314 RepID=A0A1Y0B0V0_9LAMI|nr:hypothetical protein AEK19_MT0789 [Utricularia reniformis]ART31030.1 hypothetical protein AEK19_MT0789 [Utricularia reniformis]
MLGLFFEVVIFILELHYSETSLEEAAFTMTLPTLTFTSRQLD